MLAVEFQQIAIPNSLCERQRERENAESTNEFIVCKYVTRQ